MEVTVMMGSPLLTDLVYLPGSLDQFTNQNFGSDAFRLTSSRSNGSSWTNPMPIDVYSTNNQAVILAAVPGLTPDEVGLSINQNTVTLSGTVRNPADADDAKDAIWYVSELGGGSYRRSVTLPFAVDADEATATLQHGILRVVLPKADSAKPKKIAISRNTDEAIVEMNPEA
jgi:HSP20 family molecular chaperone IbpA